MIVVYMLIHQELTLLLITFNNLGIDVILLKLNLIAVLSEIIYILRLLNRLVMSLRYL
jgi:hypothetical protein